MIRIKVLHLMHRLVSWVLNTLVTKWRRILAKSLLALISLKVFLWLWYIRLEPDQPSIICSFGTGRLGNQMSSYATMVAFSQLYKLKGYITRDQKEMLGYYFEKVRAEVLEEAVPQYYRMYWETPWKIRDKVADNYDYTKIVNKDVRRGMAINLGDFANELQYFKHYLPKLRHEFTLKSRFRLSAQAKLWTGAAGLNDGGWGPVTWVGVHNRRKDYGHHLEALYGLGYVDNDYFSQAMSYYRDKYRRVVFVVVTDDMDWAVKNIGENSSDVLFLGNSAVTEKDESNPLAVADDIGEDLALLAACNHSILSYGTFGQWAGLLAGGEVVVARG